MAAAEYPRCRRVASGILRSPRLLRALEKGAGRAVLRIAQEVIPQARARVRGAAEAQLRAAPGEGRVTVAGPLAVREAQLVSGRRREPRLEIETREAGANRSGASRGGRPARSDRRVQGL